MATTPTPIFDLSPDDQIFMKGRNSDSHKYHNIGQLRTPYIGKTANFRSAQGDYGPPQRTDYYTVQNPLYPYPMIKDMEVDQYIPNSGCAFGKPYMQTTYDYSNPDTAFVPPNMFSPKTHFDTTHDPNPKQPKKELIMNMIMPVPENIMPPRENFTFINPDSVPFVPDIDFGRRKYIKLVDTNAKIHGIMPPYKDGEKWSI